MQSKKENQLAKINEQYKDCNLLMPVASETQLSPYYKLTVMEVKPDLSANSGDVFKVGSIKQGNNWVDTFSPAKPLLMKLASAAGIQFDANNTYGTIIGSNCYKAKAFGAMRMPDGTGKTHCDEKLINLQDEEERFKLEFMDKSIKGISEEKAAKEAAKMFAGSWGDGEDKYGKACKVYRISDADRQKYIDRSVLVNMTLLRKTAAEKAMTGAILRVIRALIGMKGQYTMEELKKPFAIARVTFSPDYNDPEVRHAMLHEGLNSMSNMFGSAPKPQMLKPEMSIDAEFDVSENIDNAAFVSDEFAHGVFEETEAPPPTYEEPEVFVNELACANCNVPINQAIFNYSTKNYGLPLCMKCQKEAK